MLQPFLIVSIKVPIYACFNSLPVSQSMYNAKHNFDNSQIVSLNTHYYMVRICLIGILEITVWV